MRLTFVFLLFVAVGGVYSVTTALFNPDGPFMSANIIEQAELEENVKTLMQILRGNTSPDDEPSDDIWTIYNITSN